MSSCRICAIAVRAGAQRERLAWTAGGRIRGKGAHSGENPEKEERERKLQSITARPALGHPLLSVGDWLVAVSFHLDLALKSVNRR